MSKRLIEIASEMVQTQVSRTSMSATDIASSLRQVFSTLQALQKAEIGGIELAQSAEGSGEPGLDQKSMLSPADSIQNNKVICLECGKEFKQLTQKHLGLHDMTPKEYRKKYGFTMKTPLAAKSLIKARSKAAKQRGLPENLKKFQEERKRKKAEASTNAVPETVTDSKPKRTRIRKKKA